MAVDPTVVFNEGERELLARIFEAAVARGIPEMEIAEASGVVLADYTEGAGVAPRGPALKDHALESIRRSVAAAYKAGATAGEISVAAVKGAD